MLANQERGIRGIRELPEYWIPPLATLSNTQRLREILAIHQVQSFLNNYHINIASISDDNLHASISLIARKLPS
jgi:hypothetical protein